MNRFFDSVVTNLETISFLVDRLSESVDRDRLAIERENEALRRAVEVAAQECRRWRTFHELDADLARYWEARERYFNEAAARHRMEGRSDSGHGTADTKPAAPSPPPSKPAPAIPAPPPATPPPCTAPTTGGESGTGDRLMDLLVKTMRDIGVEPVVKPPERGTCRIDIFPPRNGDTGPRRQGP